VLRSKSCQNHHSEFNPSVTIVVNKQPMESAQSVESLMLANLLNVFNDRSPQSRAAAISKNYSPDIISASQTRYIEAMAKLISAYKPCWASHRGGSLNQVVPF
jgi:hypothetical protein